MRDPKRMLAVGVFLAAVPAWASDMSGLVGLVLLPPVYLWVLIAGIIGLTVSQPRSARISMGVLVVGGLPALGAALLGIAASFHDDELQHETMFAYAVGAIVLLIASHAWAFRRLLTLLPKREENS
ncbi:hypothetical protein JYK02_11485 [Corallococcus macrosporus]|uniref:Uncharacterized protein n=1 Tax=Corallococcus macrosporus TaxID=35 RepID=A0ABS3DCI7_9BACT|nr:hypothetical protein [Corallococcus macrosporus]MBN8228130.1 hypothetical protein [Corallococcus macrosporus]